MGTVRNKSTRGKKPDTPLWSRRRECYGHTPFGHRLVCPVCNAAFQGANGEEKYKAHYKKEHTK